MRIEHRRSRRWLRFITLLLAIALAVGVATPPGGVAPTAAAPLDGSGALEAAAAVDEEALELAARGEDDVHAGGLVGAPLEFDRPLTLEEMRTAQPLDLPEVTGRPGGLAPAGLAPTGPPIFIPGTLPSGRPAPAGEEDDLASQALHRVPTLRVEQFPHMTVGKLFFQRGNLIGECSAASIGNYAVWTAGHCIHEGKGGSFVRNVVFVPAFQGQPASRIPCPPGERPPCSSGSGYAPFGYWRGTYAITTGAWIRRGDPLGFPYDYAGVVVTDYSGRPLDRVVGALGFAVNLPLRTGGPGTGLEFRALGYPVALGGGKEMWECASKADRVNIWAAFGPTNPGMPCDRPDLKGMSGGPWLRGAMVAGNTSYIETVDGIPRQFTPYYNEDTLALRNAIVGRKPQSRPGLSIPTFSLSPQAVRNPPPTGAAVTGTIKLGAPAAGGVTFQISSAGRARAVHPAQVAIPAGQAQKTFAIRVFRCGGGSTVPCSATIRLTFPGGTLEQTVRVTTAGGL